MNLKLLRQKKNLTQIEVANQLGITQTAYSRYESGARQPDIETLKRLASFYEVTVDQILGTDTEQNPSTGFGREIKIKPVPEYEDEVSLPIVATLRCGFGISGDPWVVVGHKGVPVSFVKNWGNDLVLNEAVGNSMSPTIRPHDLMVCSPGDWWDDGMVVIVNVNDSDTVKRIYHAEDGGIDLVPENPAYKSMHYTPKDIEELHITVLAHVLTIVPPDIHPIPRRKENEP